MLRGNEIALFQSLLSVGPQLRSCSPELCSKVVVLILELADCQFPPV